MNFPGGDAEQTFRILIEISVKHPDGVVAAGNILLENQIWLVWALHLVVLEQHVIPAGCDLRVDLEPNLPPVRADEGAVVSALLNLLDNALKYTTDNKQVVVRVTRANDDVAFQVQDNGIGIPPREHRRIFRRFYRVDQRLASATSGVGLGLSIVELIAHAHGGSVSVQSAEGAGSTFTLYVPGAIGKGRVGGQPLPTKAASA